MRQTVFASSGAEWPYQYVWREEEWVGLSPLPQGVYELDSLMSSLFLTPFRAFDA
jgi:hypothetical protein